MTTPHLSRLGTLAVLAVAVSAVLGVIELAVVAVPFLVAIVTGLLRRPADVSLELALEPRRCFEGEPVRLSITVAATARVDCITVVLDLPRTLVLSAGSARTVLVVEPGERRVLDVDITARRWGRHDVGAVRAVAYTRGRLVAERVEAAGRVAIDVYPRPERFQVRDHHPAPRVLAGVHVSRAGGDGIEFAGIRPFVSGDSVRRVNWRASARHGGLLVSESHPERDAEVVLFLDTFADVGRWGTSSLDVTVRATLALAEHYLRLMDRVALIGFGGVLRWLTPGSGRMQLFRIVEHVLGTEAVLNYAWKDIQRVPRQSLPPRSLVIALSPLLDERARGAIVDLAARNHPTAIIDTMPADFPSPPPDAPSTLAQRLWRAEREVSLHRLRELGVPVIAWSDHDNLDVVLQQLTRVRRRPWVMHR